MRFKFIKKFSAQLGSLNKNYKCHSVTSIQETFKDSIYNTSETGVQVCLSSSSLLITENVAHILFKFFD